MNGIVRRRSSWEKSLGREDPGVREDRGLSAPGHYQCLSCPIARDLALAIDQTVKAKFGSLREVLAGLSRRDEGLMYRLKRRMHLEPSGVSTQCRKVRQRNQTRMGLCDEAQHDCNCNVGVFDAIAEPIGAASLAAALLEQGQCAGDLHAASGRPNFRCVAVKGFLVEETDCFFAQAGGERGNL